jgi:hypothetical protein
MMFQAKQCDLDTRLRRRCWGFGVNQELKEALLKHAFAIVDRVCSDTEIKTVSSRKTGRGRRMRKQWRKGGVWSD